MYDKIEEEVQGDCSQGINNIQGFQEQILIQQQEMMQQPNNTLNDAYIMAAMGGGTSNRSGFMVPEVVSPWTLPSLHNFNPVQFQTNPYGALFNRRPTPPGLQFAYEGLISDGLGQVGLHNQADIQKMSAQEIMDAKALAASKSHSEAERRRRERINNHLAKLRSLLPSTTKTDKASLLAEVIQHVKELKRQTSMIAETSEVPSEIDELSVDNAIDEDGRLVIKASLCCEDRSDLLPDLIKTLKSLKLTTLKAEITTLGGRMKNVLVITSDQQDHEEYSITSIQEALKAVMEKSSTDDSAPGNVKRQRTNHNSL